MSTNLLNALLQLNEWLLFKNTQIELKIIGTFAMYLSGFESINTNDIDTVTDLEGDLFSKINEIGLKNHLKEDWLSDDSAGLPLPEGFNERLIHDSRFSHIKILYASRVDIIQLKAAAFVDRGNDNPKDIEDLTVLNPTNQEIICAIKFIRKTRTPEHKRFYPNFEEILNALRKLAK